MNEIIKIMAKNLKDYIHEEDVWNQIVKESDADGSGTINFDEFKEMMRNIQDNYKKWTEIYALISDTKLG